MQFAQQGVLLSGSSQSQQTAPDKPALADSMFWSATGHGYANLTTRIVNLEPSVSGVDTSYTWMFWIRPSNLKPDSNRIMVCGPLVNSNFSYVIGLNPMSSQVGNGALLISMQTSSGNSIGRYTSFPLKRGRVSHVAITYSGSEANTGIKIYINGVEDTSSVVTSAGTYTGLANDSNARIQFSPVFSSALAFGGDLKDFCFFKNFEANSTQVTEAYNSGVPGTVTSLSYYGSITAYYPFATDLTCTNNAGLNLGSSTNVATRSSNFGTSYESMSFANAYTSNSRYLAFGALAEVGTEIRIYQRSGATHLTDGLIVKMVLNETTGLFSAPVTVVDDATALMSSAGGQIDNKIVVGSAKFNGTVFTELDRWESTDGLVGETFGSAISMTPDLAGYNWYGPVMKRPGVHEWWIAEPEATSTTNYRINFWKTDGTTWTKVTAWTGAPGNAYGEPAGLWLDTMTMIVVLRSETVAGLHYMVTRDGGATWSTPVTMSLGTGICNAALCLDPNGNIVMVWMSRGTDLLYATVGNVPATILATPTAWNASSAIFKSYSTDSLGMLGYPSVVRKGWNYYIATSSEFSSSRADQMIGIGRLE